MPELSQHVCRRYLLFNETLPGWRYGLTGASWSSTKARTKSCPWDKVTPAPDEGWGSWEAALEMSSWGCWWSTGWAGTRVCLCNKEGNTLLGCISQSSALLNWSFSSSQHLLHPFGEPCAEPSSERQAWRSCSESSGVGLTAWGQGRWTSGWMGSSSTRGERRNRGNCVYCVWI